jgi:hypothetical protein
MNEYDRAPGDGKECDESVQPTTLSVPFHLS